MGGPPGGNATNEKMESRDSRLESRYGPKKGKRKKKCPSKKAQRVFRVKRGKSVTLDTTLRRLVQAFPQADHGLKV